jgi:hypothetical protein
MTLEGDRVKFIVSSTFCFLLDILFHKNQIIIITSSTNLTNSGKKILAPKLLGMIQDVFLQQNRTKTAKRVCNGSLVTRTV